MIRDVLLARGRSHRYGADRSQRADLYLPGGAGPHPVMVLIHGGGWSKRYSRIVMRALACELVAYGWAVWNIEYRRLGNGGGWPATFIDVAAAIDELDAVDAPIDLARVSVLGHSAGGQLALWAAGRDRLPAGAPGATAGHPRVQLGGVVSLAGVCDLAGAYGVGSGRAVKALMGGSPDEVPERYALADPMAAIPLPIPTLLVHGVLDESVPVRLSRNYARAAQAQGADVELVEIDGEGGGHRAHIEPRSAALAEVERWLARPAP
jgi:acetyl esterase/lipase